MMGATGIVIVVPVGNWCLSTFISLSRLERSSPSMRLDSWLQWTVVCHHRPLLIVYILLCWFKDAFRVARNQCLLYHYKHLKIGMI